MKLMEFKINAKSESPTKTVVTARNFNMVIDEPPMLGGEDHGANPVEYLLGALSGCLNVVGHLVAKEMGFDFKGLEIDIQGALNPAKFMGKETVERTGFQSIAVKIKPDTTAPAEVLEKWVEEIEKRCPVSDNIQNETPVKISLK